MTSLKKLGPFYTRDQWVWDRLITEPGEGNQPDKMSFVMGYLGQRGVLFTGYVDGPIRAGAMGDLRRKLVDRRRAQIADGVAQMANFEISGWEAFDAGDASDSPNADISVQFIQSHSGADAGQITHAEVFDCDAAVTRRVFADDSGQWPPDELLNRIEDAAMAVAAELHDLEIDESNTRTAPRTVKELLHPIVREAAPEEVESLDEANVGPRADADACLDGIVKDCAWIIGNDRLAGQFFEAVGNELTANALLELPEVTEDFVRRFIAMRNELESDQPNAAETLAMVLQPFLEDEHGQLPGHAVVLMKAVLGLFAAPEFAMAWIARLDRALSAHTASVDSHLTTMADDKGAMPQRAALSPEGTAALAAVAAQ